MPRVTCPFIFLLSQELAGVRALLTLPCTDDVIVYRFLRGHKFSVTKAAAKLNSTLAWRAETGLDELRAKAEKLTQRQFPHAERVLRVHPHKSVMHTRSACAHDGRIGLHCATFSLMPLSSASHVLPSAPLTGTTSSVSRLVSSDWGTQTRLCECTNNSVAASSPCRLAASPLDDGWHVAHAPPVSSLVTPLSLSMVRTVPFDDMLQYHFYHMESKSSLVSSLTSSRGEVLRTAKIMDLSGLSRSHLDRRGLAYFRQILDLSQHNYPEMLGKLYVVNTPWIFSLGWKIVKPWLNAQTLEKIHILGNDNILARLREDIDDEFIPDFLGGGCKCGADRGGCVPLVDPDADMMTQQVAARAKFEYTIEIDAAAFDSHRASAASTNAASSFLGVRVSWEFRTRKNDLGLEVRSTPHGGGAHTILSPLTRHQSDQAPIIGSVVVAAPCVVTLVFDNAFSMFTGKTLLFRVDTQAATSDEEAAGEADNTEEEIAEAMKDANLQETKRT